MPLWGVADNDASEPKNLSSGEVKKDTAPKKEKPKKEPKYNPYGTGTANPTNMSGSTGP